MTFGSITSGACVNLEESQFQHFHYGYFCNKKGTNVQLYNCSAMRLMIKALSPPCQQSVSFVCTILNHQFARTRKKQFDGEGTTLTRPEVRLRREVVKEDKKGVCQQEVGHCSSLGKKRRGENRRSFRLKNDAFPGVNLFAPFRVTSRLNQ